MNGQLDIVTTSNTTYVESKDESDKHGMKAISNNNENSLAKCLDLPKPILLTICSYFSLDHLVFKIGPINKVFLENTIDVLKNFDTLVNFYPKRNQEGQKRVKMLDNIPNLSQNIKSIRFNDEIFMSSKVIDYLYVLLFSYGFFYHGFH